MLVLVLVLETKSYHLALPELELTMEARMALNLKRALPCKVCSTTASLTDIFFYVWLIESVNMNSVNMGSAPIYNITYSSQVFSFGNILSSSVFKDIFNRNSEFPEPST